MPVFSRASDLARSINSRGIMQVSTTTIAKPGRPIIKNKTLGPNRVLDLGGLILEKTAIDQDRETRRCDIDRKSTSAKQSCRS